MTADVQIDEPKTYPYGFQFQKKVVALMLTQPSFCVEYADVMNPEFFDSHWLQALARITMGYVSEYKKPPTQETLEQLVTEYGIDNGLDQEDRNHFINLVRDLYHVDIRDEEYITDEIIGFGRFQAMKKALARGASELSNGRNYSSIRASIDEAMSVGSGGDSGTNVFEKMKDLPKHLKETVYNPEKKVPTGIPSIDHAFLGGLGPGEIGIVSGPTKVGKSGVLANFGVHGAKHFSGKNYKKLVIIVTNELSEADYTLRIAANMTSLRMREIIGESNAYYSRISKMREFRILVKHYPPTRASVSTIRSYIARMCSRLDAEPGLLIVDYPEGLSLPSRRDADLYMTGFKIYQQLIALCDDLGCPGWVASHIQRQSYDEEENYGTSDAAGSIAKPQLADAAIKIRQSAHEKEHNFARLYLSAVRRGPDDQLVICKYDKSRMRLREATENELDEYSSGVGERYV